MDSLWDFQCVGCTSLIGKDTEVLFCNDCHPWQHKKCTDGVADTFYQEFYLATVLGEKHKSWMCQFCCQKQPMIKEEPLITSTHAADKRNISLVLPPRPQTAQVSDSSSPYNTQCHSDDLMNLNNGVQHTEREVPACNFVKTTTNLDNRTMIASTENNVIINSQSVLSDNSREPSLYTMYKTTSGETHVTDNLGNMFTPLEDNHDETILYECTKPGCMFKVRLCETILEFLCAGSLGTEQHNHSSVFTMDTCPENQDNTSADNLSMSDIFTDIDDDDEDDADDDNDDDDVCSAIIPEITSTLFNTPGSRKRASDRLSDGYCSDSTDNEESGQAPMSLTELHHPTSRVRLNVSFSSESVDNDDCRINSICNHLDDLVDNADVPRESICITPTPATTLPAVESSQHSTESIISLPPTHQPDQSQPSVAATEHQSPARSHHQPDQSQPSVAAPEHQSPARSHLQPNQSQPSVAAPEHQSPARSHHQPNQSQPSVAAPEHHSPTRSHLSVLRQHFLASRSESPGTTHLSVMRQHFLASRLESPNRVTSPDPITNQPSSPTSEAIPHENHQDKDTSQDEQDEEVIFYEIECCLPRQKNPRSMLLTSDGFMFQTKVIHSTNNKTNWLCSEKGVDGSECEANLEFNYVLSFSTDSGSDRTWLINRADGTYTINHNHEPDHKAVTWAKLRMMIKRRIFCYGVLEEAPNSIIPNIFTGIDYKGQPYLDTNGNPVLTAVDRKHLPICPRQIQVLKRFLRSQKTAYKEETSRNNSGN